MIILIVQLKMKVSFLQHMIDERNGINGQMDGWVEWMKWVGGWDR